MRYIFIFFLIFNLTSIYAQEDRFVNVQETMGKTVYVTDNSAVAVAYMMVGNKIKPVNKTKNVSVNMAGKIFSVGINEYVFKKKDYLVLKCGELTVLLKEEDAPLYLSSFISYTYWQNKYDQYKNEYAYMNIKRGIEYHSDKSTIVYDELSNIRWEGFDLSGNVVTYNLCETAGDGNGHSFEISSDKFEKSKDLIFLKNNAIQYYIENYEARLAREKREKEIQDSITNAKLRLATVIKDAHYNNGEYNIDVSVGDTLAIFTFNKENGMFVAMHRLSKINLAPTNIKFLDTKTIKTKGTYSWETRTEETSTDAEYLKLKGEDGIIDRLHTAFEYDSIHTVEYINRMKLAIAEYNRDVAYKQKNQIFILGIGYEYAEYGGEFGMHFDVYNCFTKTIKYVEFTLTNYNAVGDVQRDDLGRATRTVKGIGPIEPQNGGRYSWDDIFWDDRDIIDVTKLTNVKFIFTDGSTKVFSGSSNINKHMTDDAWDD